MRNHPKPKIRNRLVVPASGNFLKARAAVREAAHRAHGVANIRPRPFLAWSPISDGSLAIAVQLRLSYGGPLAYHRLPNDHTTITQVCWLAHYPVILGELYPTGRATVTIESDRGIRSYDVVDGMTCTGDYETECNALGQAALEIVAERHLPLPAELAREVTIIAEARSRLRCY